MKSPYWSLGFSSLGNNNDGEAQLLIRHRFNKPVKVPSRLLEQKRMASPFPLLRQVIPILSFSVRPRSLLILIGRALCGVGLIGLPGGPVSPPYRVLVRWMPSLRLVTTRVVRLRSLGAGRFSIIPVRLAARKLSPSSLSIALGRPSRCRSPVSVSWSPFSPWVVRLRARL